ncbi:hypothetical protein S7711_05489 [Stachybotrys chartarum IBT 7711]|uniref:Uncharacterized protein n=1 Tax=Stachybotrys chartarum (strain CBS 109288 / IBT 7711) TaxID=1280523 RepID=A0A084ARZ7_STACB|nr:hypothetical protein S7711_05489 [Stachybotrys chartarum IBT 7711]
MSIQGSSHAQAREDNHQDGSYEWYDADPMAVSQAAALCKTQQTLRENLVYLEDTKHGLRHISMRQGQLCTVLFEEVCELVRDQEAQVKLMANKKKQIESCLAQNPHPPVSPSIVVLEKAVVAALRKFAENQYLISQLKPDLNGHCSWTSSQVTFSAVSRPRSSLKAQRGLVAAQVFHDGDSENPADHIILKYHPGINRLRAPILHAPCPSPGTAAQILTRRITISNLPKSITLCQVLRGVYGHGPLKNASIFNCGAAHPTATAIIEFHYPACVRHYVDFRTRKTLAYEDENYSVHKAVVRAVPTNSYCYATARSFLQDTTRCISVENMPLRHVWFYLNVIGLRHITDVSYNKETKTLSIDLVSNFHADRIIDMTNNWITKDYPDLNAHSIQEFDPPDTGGDPSVRPKGTIRPGVFAYVAPNHLREKWDCIPYNTFWPTRLSAYMCNEHLSPMRPSHPPSVRLKSLAKHLNLHESQVEDYFKKLREFKEIKNGTLGSAKLISQRKWSYIFEWNQFMVYILETSLHEPGMEHDWDEYFEAHDLINLRTLERYARLAAHRREMAKKQGLGEGELPKCGSACPMGCRGLEDSPVAKVIVDFLKLPERITFVSTTDTDTSF